MRYWIVVAVIAFFLNLLWENAHSVLYDHAIPGWRFLQASLGDVGLVGLGVGLAWPLRRRSRRAFEGGTVVALTVLAVAVELHAAATMRWAYTDAMPVIAGIGLTPLIQLSLTGLASLWTAARVVVVPAPPDRW